MANSKPAVRPAKKTLRTYLAAQQWAEKENLDPQRCLDVMRKAAKGGKFIDAKAAEAAMDRENARQASRRAATQDAVAEDVEAAE